MLNEFLIQLPFCKGSALSRAGTIGEEWALAPEEWFSQFLTGLMLKDFPPEHRFHSGTKTPFSVRGPAR
jgi:hypothetical protein